VTNAHAASAVNAVLREECRLLRNIAFVFAIAVFAMLLHWRFLNPGEHEALTTFLLALTSVVGCAIFYAAWKDR
jgi:hypothetical protein